MESKILLPDEILNRELKKYELKTQNHQHIESHNEYLFTVQEILNHYTSMITDHQIEDEWTLYDSSSRKYDIDNDTIIFDNTMDTKYYFDVTTNKFLSLLVEYISRISNKYKVTSKIVNGYYDKVSLIVIKIKKLF